MKRRGFLQLMACLPGMGFLKPEAAPAVATTFCHDTFERRTIDESWSGLWSGDGDLTITPARDYERGVTIQAPRPVDAARYSPARIGEDWGKYKDRFGEELHIHGGQPRSLNVRHNDYELEACALEQGDHISLEVDGTHWRAYHGRVLLGKGELAPRWKHEMKYKPTLPEWF